MAEDLRKAFHHDLDALRADIIRLGALAGEAITRGTEALLSSDLDAAQAVIDGDDVLDALSLAIEERAFMILARQSPMAGDLRAVVADLKINADIERSADLMTNVAKGARRLFGARLTPKLRGALTAMSDEAGRLFRLSLDCYAERNGGLAAALDDIDDLLDDLHVEYIQAVFQAHAEGAIDLQAAVQLALIGRFYERIGDHAVNVGERVRFMVDGWTPEQSGAARQHERERRLDGVDAAAGD
ncbi:MAG: phosphate signaling complex protein PhoU [Acidimicrobiales bacterium]